MGKANQLHFNIRYPRRSVYRKWVFQPNRNADNFVIYSFFPPVFALQNMKKGFPMLIGFVPIFCLFYF